MTMIYNLKIFLAISLAFLIFAFSSFSYAESDITEGYDENTEISIKGAVIDILSGMRGPVIIKIKTDSKTPNVVIAPKWYLSRIALELEIGSTVEITGSKYFARDGNLYIIARLIKDPEKGRTVILRDVHYKPLWRGRRH